MDTKKQYISVFAICLAIVLAAGVIAYKPFAPEVELDDTFKFPVGVPPTLGTFQSVAVGEDQVYAIYVSGSGSDSAKANQATVTLGAYTEDVSAAEAVQDNAVIMNAVIEAIKAEGISEDKIKTVSYSVNPNYDWEIRQTVGYRVTNMIQVEIDDIGKVGDVLDAATGAGANNVQGISFGLSDESSAGLQGNAYVNALNDARGKADLIAKTLGLRITGVLSVSESVYYPYTPYRAYAESDVAGAPAPTPILEGTLSVSVSVQVSFTFEQIS
jgi:uncharacterized protein YggE